MSVEAPEPGTFPMAIQIQCSAYVTHPDGTVDDDEGGN